MSILVNNRTKTILAMVVVLLFAMSAVAFAGSGNPTVDSIIFELNGEYHEVDLNDWADAYYAGPGDPLYDKFIQATIVGIRSGDKYIDFDSYAQKYYENPETALDEADELDSTIVENIIPYDPIDDPEELKVIEVTAITRTVDYGTQKGDIDFPSEVEATLDDNSTIDVDVDWDDESTPPYDSQDPGEYVFEGTLENLPENVINPDNVKAELTVTVRDVEPVTEMEVANETDFDDARNAEAERIILTDNITFEDRERIRWDLWELDMDGYTITLEGGPLAFEADSTTIKNGKIVGDLTWWSWEGPADAWDDEAWDGWQNTNRVMVSGDGVIFEDIDFHVDIADWYQKQGDKDATNLTVRDSALHGVSLFNSNVRLCGNEIYNRVGIECDDAVLEGNTLRDATVGAPDVHADLAGLYGILYINSDATLIDNYWANNFTGMFVGKSLKYYGEYSPAEPTLDGATIWTDKSGLVWWAINHEKAELNTTGIVDITSERGGPGLMVVGTDARDYAEGTELYEAIEECIVPSVGDEWDGGAILGDAEFTGADVWIGKPTNEFLNEKKENYEGEWLNECKCEKCGKVSVCLKEVDYQVCKKDADRLRIHGPTFVSDVTIFTPANDYLECEGYAVPLADPVWLGDVTFGYVSLWGDFDIVQGKTVTFDEIELKCGNIRRIGTDRDLGSKEVCTVPHPEFTRRGILTGGIITSDTKEDNVLVLGDGVQVENVELSRWLYNVILETVWLDDVTINVGQSNTNDQREVCWESYQLEYDVTVWDGNHATFGEVSLLNGTTAEVMDLSKLTILDVEDFTNNGLVKVQKEGFVNFPPFDANIEISQRGGRAYVDYGVEAWDNWKFNDWKPDIWIEAGDEIYSKKYEIIFPYNDGDYTEADKYIVDLRDPDRPLLNGAQHPNAPFDISKGEGIWLTDLLDIDRETLATILEEAEMDFRISLDEDTDEEITFQLDVTGYIFNCCDYGFELANDSKDITLTGKFVQGFLPTLLECEVDYDELTVTAEIKNTSNQTRTQTVMGWTDFEGDEVASTSEEMTIRPGRTETISWTLDLADYGDPGDTLEFENWVETEDRTDNRTCTVVYIIPFDVECSEWTDWRSGSGPGGLQIPMRVELWDISSVETGAEIDIEYERYRIRDRFRVYYDGELEYDSGFGSGSELSEGIITKEAGVDYLSVVITNNSRFSEWDYRLRCRKGSFFEAEIDVVDPLGTGSFDVTYRVNNLGPGEDTQEVTYAAFVSFDEGDTWATVGMVDSDNKTIAGNGTWENTVGYNAQENSKWMFTLVTEDDDAEEVREVVNK